MLVRLETGTRNGVPSRQEASCSSSLMRSKRWPKHRSAGQSAERKPVATSSHDGIPTPWSIATRMDSSPSWPWLITNGIPSTGCTVSRSPSSACRGSPSRHDSPSGSHGEGPRGCAGESLASRSPGFAAAITTSATPTAVRSSFRSIPASRSDPASWRRSSETPSWTARSFGQTCEHGPL